MQSANAPPVLTAQEREELTALLARVRLLVERDKLLPSSLGTVELIFEDFAMRHTKPEWSVRVSCERGHDFFAEAKQRIRGVRGMDGEGEGEKEIHFAVYAAGMDGRVKLASAQGYWDLKAPTSCIYYWIGEAPESPMQKLKRLKEEAERRLKGGLKEEKAEQRQREAEQQRLKDEAERRLRDEVEKAEQRQREAEQRQREAEQRQREAEERLRDEVEKSRAVDAEI